MQLGVQAPGRGMLWGCILQGGTLERPRRAGGVLLGVQGPPRGHEPPSYLPRQRPEAKLTCVSLSLFPPEAEWQVAEAQALVRTLDRWSVVETLVVPTRTPDRKLVFGRGALQQLTGGSLEVPGLPYPRPTGVSCP